MLHIRLVLVCLKSVSLDTSVTPVENDPLINGSAAHSVLHAAHDLKLVFIDLPWLCNGREAESVLKVVLQQESIGNLLKSEGVLVM